MAKGKNVERCGTVQAGRWWKSMGMVFVPASEKRTT